MNSMVRFHSFFRRPLSSFLIHNPPNSSLCRSFFKGQGLYRTCSSNASSTVKQVPVNDNGNYLVVNHDNKVCLLSLDHLHKKQFETTSIDFSYYFSHSHEYIASCNGLILLCQDKSRDLLSIWNPLTKELHRLPKTVHSLDHVDSNVIGFGYDSVSDDYKVLTFLPYYEINGGFKSHLWVYSLRLNSWKQVDDVPYMIVREKKGAMVNGALHRVVAEYRYGTECDKYKYLIMAFDLDTEKCRFYQFPKRRWNISCKAYNLVELNGCLSSSLHHGDYSDLDVWSMKEYGGEWTQLFSVKENLLETTSRFFHHYVETSWIVSYLESEGVVLIEKDDGKLMRFNLRENTLSDVLVHGEVKLLSPQVFIPSLERIKRSSF